MHTSFERKIKLIFEKFAYNYADSLDHQLVSCSKAVSGDLQRYLSAPQAVILQTTAPSNMPSSFYVAAVAVELSTVPITHKVDSHSFLFIYCL